jgi:hypothetical protein
VAAPAFPTVTALPHTLYPLVNHLESRAAFIRFIARYCAPKYPYFHYCFFASSQLCWFLIDDSLFPFSSVGSELTDAGAAEEENYNATDL